MFSAAHCWERRPWAGLTGTFAIFRAPRKADGDLVRARRPSLKDGRHVDRENKGRNYFQHSGLGTWNRTAEGMRYTDGTRVGARNVCIPFSCSRHGRYSLTPQATLDDLWNSEKKKEGKTNRRKTNERTIPIRLLFSLRDSVRNGPLYSVRT